MTDTSKAARLSRPAVGLSQRLLGRFHVTGVFWQQVQVWYTQRVPLWMHGIAIFGFTVLFFVVLTRIRRAIAANLEPVLGRAGPLASLARSWRTMYTFARCRSERMASLNGKPRGVTKVEGREHWDRILAGNDGVVVVTAHIGAWDSAAAGIEHAQRKVHVVREEEIDPRAQAVVREQLRAVGDHYIAHFVAKNDTALPLKLLEALRNGDIVALQGDRPAAEGRTVTVEMFGRPFLLPAGPAALARASGKPLVPVFNFLDPDYSVRSVVRAPIYVNCSDDRDADLREAVVTLAREIEWAIREQPHQWFCFNNVWS